MVCENSDVRKLLNKLKLEVIIDRDSNMGAFTYDICSNLGGGGGMMASAKKFETEDNS